MGASIRHLALCYGGPGAGRARKVTARDLDAFEADGGCSAALACGLEHVLHAGIARNGAPSSGIKGRAAFHKRRCHRARYLVAIAWHYRRRGGKGTVRAEHEAGRGAAIVSVDRAVDVLAARYPFNVRSSIRKRVER